MVFTDPTMVYHLKPKNPTDGPNLFFKIQRKFYDQTITFMKT